MQGRRWIVPLVILALLLTASAFRWKEEASKTGDEWVVKWERDTWTRDLWLRGYAIEGSGMRLSLPERLYTDKKHDAAYAKMNTLSTARDIAVGIVIVWLAIEILIARRKPKEEESVKTE